MKNEGIKRTDVRVRKTYSILTQAFFMLLKTTPYESISVIDICEESGVHRATFYKHFNDKQDFVDFCFKNTIDEICLDKIHDDYTDFNHSKEAYLKAQKQVLEYIYENKSIFQNLNSSAGTNIFLTALESSIYKFIELRLSKRLPENQSFRFPIPLLASYYSGAISSVIRWWLTDGNDYSKEDMMEFSIAKYNEVSLSFVNGKANL